MTFLVACRHNTQIVRSHLLQIHNLVRAGQTVRAIAGCSFECRHDQRTRLAGHYLCHRNWHVHGVLLSTRFRGPRKVELYIKTINKALAEVLDGVGNRLQALFSRQIAHKAKS